MTQKPILSKKAVDRLIRAGWSRNRKIDLSDILLQYKKFGYHITKCNEQFLTSFMNISLSFNNHESLFEFRTPTNSKDQFEKFFNSLDTDFIYIGSIHNYMFDLLLGEDNRMYAAGDTTVFLIGNDLSEGINFICESGLKPSLSYKKRFNLTEY